MDLVTLYNEYKKYSQEYMSYISDLVDSDLGKCENEGILDKLKSYQVKFEDIKIKADVVEVDEANMQNLQDLKYLVMDVLFAALDLATFYSYKEVERFKMRATNIINKKRRSEMFNESMHAPCRVDF
ncbi:hypothetical protein [uncultured Clostridium sp.]|uniref:hypothetical protein n=1 Tax=uncultured Clostridium sp. TaxID=59620 RepID=UPI002621E7F0|nr:hypothetical protein [uncultured Clostridium sp.]